MKIKKGIIEINLREHLFWDIPGDFVDPVKSKRLIIERVSTRGTLNEFRQILNLYGQKDFLNTIKQIGYLDNKTVNYLVKIFGIRKEELKCYKPKQLRV